MENQIVGLSDEEIHEVGGGIVVIALVAAVAATTVLVSFTAGLFDGIYQKETQSN